MSIKKEMTAPNVSVGADTEQPYKTNCNNSIVEKAENSNTKKKKFNDNELQLMDDFNRSGLYTRSLNEIYDMTFEDKPALIESVLYPGVYLFSGTPKVGKSFLMAQLAYHVSTGTPLWNYKTRENDVLYLALEDDFYRIQKRMYRMFGADGNDRLHFSISSKALGNGLENQITEFLIRYPKTRLIIIDTLQKIRDGVDENSSYAKDYETIEKLRNIIRGTDRCMIIVHHNRKQKSDDKFDMISGTQGLFGASDGAFLIYKDKRVSAEAVVEISGRDQPEQKLNIEKDPETLVWKLVKAEAETWEEPPEPILDEIAKLVCADKPQWTGTATELADILGTEMKPNSLSMKINVNAGRLKREHNIEFEIKRTHTGRTVSLRYIAPEA